MPTSRRLRAVSAPQSVPVYRPQARPDRVAKARPPLPPFEAAEDALKTAVAAFGSEDARVFAAEKLEAVVPAFRAATGPVAQQLGRRLSRLANALRRNNLEVAEYSYERAQERLSAACGENRLGLQAVA